MTELDKNRWTVEATADDIYYCYRLLLGREPDEGGWNYWNQKLLDEKLSYARLAAYFRQSKEYISDTRARGIQLVTLTEFDLYVYEHDWDIGEHLIKSRQYEPQVTNFLKNHLREGMAFVDVGANIGYFTLLAARQVGKGGTVIAVECNPRNCELLYMSLHRNNFGEVLVYPFAVSDRRKLMNLTAGFSNGVVGELGEDDEESTIVPAVTLDFLLRHEPRIDIIKMDIEGSEAKAWQGMRQIIEQHQPVVMMEFFPALLERISEIKAEEFIREIFDQGYTASILQAALGEAIEASTPQEVMTLWEKQCEAIGDETRAYLDLALHPRKAVSRATADETVACPED